MRRIIVVIALTAFVGTVATLDIQILFPLPPAKPVPPQVRPQRPQEEPIPVARAVTPPGVVVGVHQAELIRYWPYHPPGEFGVRVFWVVTDTVAPPTSVRLYRVYQETRPASDLNLSGMRPDYYGWGLSVTGHMAWTWNPKEVPENPRPLRHQDQTWLGTPGFVPTYWVKAVLARDNELLGETEWVPVYPFRSIKLKRWPPARDPARLGRL